MDKGITKRKIQKNLHYIFEPGAPASPAKPLQDLIVLKQTAATEVNRLELEL